MTTLKFVDLMWRCDNCKKPIMLPGIAPSIEMLKELNWRFCPFCGEMIDLNVTVDRQELPDDP